MKKLILIIVLLSTMSLSFGQSGPILLYGDLQGNLRDLTGLWFNTLDNKVLNVLGGKFTLTQTGAEVQTILDGTYGVDFLITEATPTLTIKDSDVAANTSEIIFAANSNPLISIWNSQNELGTIGITNTQNLTFGAVGVAFLATNGEARGGFTMGSATTDGSFNLKDAVEAIQVLLSSSGESYIKGGGLTAIRYNYGLDTSATTDDYKVVITNLPDYGASGIRAGTTVWIDVKGGSGTPADNTGACQLYINGYAAKDIKTQNGGDPAVGWIDVESVFGLIYNGTVWLLTTPDANP